MGFLLHYGSKDLQRAVRMAGLPLFFFFGGCDPPKEKVGWLYMRLYKKAMYMR